MAEKQPPSSSFHKNEGSGSGTNSGRGETLDVTDEITEAAPKADLDRREGITGEESGIHEEEHGGKSSWSVRGMPERTGVVHDD